ncbi:MAG TPA: SMC family ATPase [Candidatus Enterococcus avicola]|uniref:Nuclease SbcCD subunit C n=1 Tax=Candidatus Enterococcus avicola TaxID=2838561 RepID=A0A9D2F608_9ENTE|nr:SMC family ATPase [Candidatus Enterococcus avicola]
MQPRTLVLQNFGPFIDETIDFRTFEDGGLFLISGKTGAGKTTIFDSMTYALFGETSGQQRSGKEMRSLFASPEEMTKVTFTFEYQGFFYEVERTPEQTLKKKRGEGTTNQASKVVLTIFDAAMKEQRQLTKRTEVDAFIKDLLQLDAKQFFQVMLLPQGEFRNFLIASSGEKEKLLRNLFGTAIYQRLTEWLSLLFKDKNKELDKKQHQMQALGENFIWFNEKVESPTLQEQFGYWQVDVEQLATAIEENEQLTEALKVAVGLSEKAFYEGKQLVERKMAYDQRVLEFQELEQQKVAIDELRRTVTFLRQLEKDQSLLKQVAQTRQQVSTEQLLLTEIVTLLEEVSEDMQVWQAGSADYEQQKILLQEQCLTEERLNRLLPLAQQVEQLRQELQIGQQEMDAIEQKMNLLIDELKQVVDTISQIKQQIQEKNDLQAEALVLTTLKNQVARWDELDRDNESNQSAQVENQRKIEKQRADLKISQEAAEKQEMIFRQLQSEYAKLQIEKWRQKLLPGEPCQVCGSLEHPYLEQKTHGKIASYRVTEEEVEREEDRCQQLKAQVTEQQLKLQKIALEGEKLLEQQAKSQALQADLVKIMQEKLSFSNKQTPRVAYQLRVEAFEVASQRIEKLEQQLIIYQEKQEKLLKEQAIHLEKKHELVATRLQQQTRVDSLIEQLGGLTATELQAKQAQVQDEIVLLQTKIEDYEVKGQNLKHQEVTYTERQAAKKAQLEQLEQQLNQQEQLLQEVLTHYSPEMTEEMLRQRLPDLAILPELIEQVTQYDQQVQFLSQRLAEEAELKTVELPDMSCLEAKYQEKQAVFETHQQRCFQQVSDLKRNQTLLAELNTLWQENQMALEELSHLQQLAETVKGDNSERLSLERYVLQGFLVEVLEVANQRLSKLTRNRYQFLLAEEKGSYRSSTGLEINIYDDNAGTSRRAQTLSGGESFIAALALALSLADVIQQRSGGIAIEALFIDEGFGSLDEESLEMAMQALEMIEQEGRLIGIISHVSELKHRVVQQLIVETNGSGQSRTRIKIG